MFERLQKPFLTVETGEAYQPIRLTYRLSNAAEITNLLNTLKCCEKTSTPNTWHWFWRDECETLHFESLDSFKKNPSKAIRLGSIVLRENILYLNLTSFKRACLAVPFFYEKLQSNITHVLHADFINKVFGIDERLPHGFTELFKEDELEKIVTERLRNYHEVQERVEHAASLEEAFTLLSTYTQEEAKKRLPYAERYSFEQTHNDNAEMTFLGFYIFLRGRELVAIRRWFGETSFTLSEMLDETVEKVFGGMDIDIIE